MARNVRREGIAHHQRASGGLAVEPTGGGTLSGTLTPGELERAVEMIRALPPSPPEPPGRDPELPALDVGEHEPSEAAEADEQSRLRAQFERAYEAERAALEFLPESPCNADALGDDVFARASLRREQRPVPRRR
jgi:hypothetical protein